MLSRCVMRHVYCLWDITCLGLTCAHGAISAVSYTPTPLLALITSLPCHFTC